MAPGQCDTAHVGGNHSPDILYLFAPGKGHSHIISIGIEVIERQTMAARRARAFRFT